MTEVEVVPTESVPVVIGDETPTLADDAKKSTGRSAPKWEVETRDRLRTQIKRFAKPLSDLSARSANEGDTRLLVTDFLCDALGFDKFADLTTEYQVRGEFADYGVRIDGELIAFIEVKRMGTKLGPKQLRQVEMYAVNEGVEWVILTNGAEWQLYHLTGGLPIIIDAVFVINLLSDISASTKIDQFFYLTRESLKRSQIDDLWKARRATSPVSLAQVLTSELVMTVVRKELRRITGHNADPVELTRIMRETVLRPECFEK